MVHTRNDSRRALAAWLIAGASVAAIAGMNHPASAAPASGETYAYRLVNGYNKEVRGEVRYRVDKVDGDSVTVSVAPDKPETGTGRIEVYTKEGHWLRRPLDNHGQNVEYLFSPAFPAYAFPLDAGKTWSTRVNATVQGVPGVRTVRVEGKVLGTERIRVPAGEFDTVKVQRTVYPGDAAGMRQETRISQIDWYAPALGLPVRSETRSQYVDLQFCSSSVCVHYGNWDVVELIEAGAARR